MGVLEKIIIGLELEDDKFRTAMRRLGGTLRDAQGRFASVGNATQVTGSRMSTFSMTVRGLSRRMEAFSRNFQMWALGVMFFGMQMQRTFTRIATSGVGSFMRITEGATLAGQGITSLSVHFELLKFAVGNAIATALMPLLPTIVDIITQIKDWIEENPKLFTGIVLMGIAVGGLLFIVGMLTLGISSLVGMIGKFMFLITGSQTFLAIGAFRTAMIGLAGTFVASAKAMGAAMFSFLANPIVLAIIGIVAAVVWLKFAWENNWLNIRQTTGHMVRGIAVIFFGLVEAAQIMVNGALVLWNGLLTGIELIANGIITIVNAIGGAWAWLTGTTFEPISMSDLSAFKANIGEVNRNIENFQRNWFMAIGGVGDEFTRQGEDMNAQIAAGTFVPFGWGDFWGQLAGTLGLGGGAGGGGVTENNQVINIDNFNLQFPPGTVPGPELFTGAIDDALTARGLSPPV